MSLTREVILSAANDMVRRHGPAKATVVDVAQALGVSHGSIYRFFPTKAALREAVVGAWLDQITSTLQAHPFEGSAADQLRDWFRRYMAVKQNQRSGSPELFEAFRELSAHEPQAIAAYKAQLVKQLTALVSSGVAAGELVATDARVTAQALLNATLKFHHPAFAHTWGTPAAAAEFEAVWGLLVPNLCSVRKSV